MPRVLQVIESEVVRGCGGGSFGYGCHEAHTHEIMRRVMQYHTLDGEFLAEHDSVPPEMRVINAFQVAEHD